MGVALENSAVELRLAGSSGRAARRVVPVWSLAVAILESLAATAYGGDQAREVLPLRSRSDAAEHFR